MKCWCFKSPKKPTKFHSEIKRPLEGTELIKKKLVRPGFYNILSALCKYIFSNLGKKCAPCFDIVTNIALAD